MKFESIYAALVVVALHALMTQVAREFAVVGPVWTATLLAGVVVGAVVLLVRRRGASGG
jgi:hypothetical protein